MALTAKVLAECLSEYHGDLYGSGEAKIFEARLRTSHTQFSQGTLYISAADSPAAPGQGIPIFHAPEGRERDALSRAQSLIAEDYRRSSALTELYRAVAGGASPDELFHACHEVMENPVWILDNQLQAIAPFTANGSKSTTPPFPRQKEFYANSPLTVIEADAACPCRRVLGTIFSGNKVCGFVLVFETDRKFNEAIDKQYVEALCSALAGWEQFNGTGGAIPSREKFILDLLQNRINSPTVIQQKLKDLRWLTSEKYYVVAVDMGGLRRSQTVKDRLRLILRQDIYDYSHYYIAILGRDINWNIKADDFPELLAFLNENDLYAGLSNAFWDFSMLNRAFEQCAVSIPLRKRFSKDVRFARYEDLMLAHLLDIASENGISALSFCHPIVNKIYEYDQEHNTDYLETLTAYIFYNLSLPQAADMLYIHRNTMYHRVNKIKELFNIDFDNPRLFMKLRISTAVYNYLGKLNTLHILGPLN